MINSLFVVCLIVLSVLDFFIRKAWVSLEKLYSAAVASHTGAVLLSWAISASVFSGSV